MLLEIKINVVISSCAGAMQPLASVEEDKPCNRFNDAKCDQMGRLWCGTMRLGPETSPDFPKGQGCLYSIDDKCEYMYHTACMYASGVKRVSIVLYVCMFMSANNFVRCGLHRDGMSRCYYRIWNVITEYGIISTLLLVQINISTLLLVQIWNY